MLIKMSTQIKGHTYHIQNKNGHIDLPLTPAHEDSGTWDVPNAFSIMDFMNQFYSTIRSVADGNFLNVSAQHVLIEDNDYLEATLTNVASTIKVSSVGPVIDNEAACIFEYQLPGGKVTTCPSYYIAPILLWRDTSFQEGPPVAPLWIRPA